MREQSSITYLNLRPFVLFLIFLPTLGWIFKSPFEDVDVMGQVTNGTLGTTAPADLPVTLHVSDGVEEIESYTSSLSGDGLFRFDDVALVDGYLVVVDVVYQGVTYSSELVAFESGQREVTLPVTVYEVTEDQSAIQVTQLHIFVSMEANRLQVGEYYLVGNTGRRSYIGSIDSDIGERITLSFDLPENAENLRFDESGLGDRYLKRVGGFADTLPIVPGVATVEVLFSYELPYREGKPIEHNVPVPVASIVFLLSGDGFALVGEDLSSGEMLNTQMGPARSYTAGPLTAGDRLVFSVVQDTSSLTTPVAPRKSLTHSVTREIIVGSVALVTASGLAYLMWHSPASEPGPVFDDVRPLIVEIAALDADFEAGRVPEGDYRRKRRQLKRRVLALWNEKEH